MNKWLMSRSRRERFYLLLGAAILIFGLGVYPLIKRSASLRAEQMDTLEQTRELLADYQSMIDSKEAIRAENDHLAELMSATDGFLFERTGNNVMMEAMMTKLLNQFGPDLKLDVSESRAAVRDDASQIRFQVSGSGRYLAVLNFIYQMETYRPFIVIDAVSVTVSTPKTRNRRSRRSAPTPATETTTEPTIKLKLDIHINCASSEEAS